MRCYKDIRLYYDVYWCIMYDLLLMSFTYLWLGTQLHLKNNLSLGLQRLPSHPISPQCMGSTVRWCPFVPAGPHLRTHSESLPSPCAEQNDIYIHLQHHLVCEFAPHFRLKSSCFPRGVRNHQANMSQKGCGEPDWTFQCTTHIVWTKIFSDPNQLGLHSLALGILHCCKTEPGHQTRAVDINLILYHLYN